MKSSFVRFSVACFIAIFTSNPFLSLPASAQQTGTTIVGQVLDVSGGLPVPGATVKLEHGTNVVDTTTTAPDGSFSFKNAPPGVYNVLIAADGYQATLSDDVFVLANETQVRVRTAIQRTTAGPLRTIANVRVNGNTSLQTTATINEHIDASVLQSQNFMRGGDALATLPFVNGSTSSSIGDDLSLSIRGFDSSETTTLVDGHPVGPLGAYGKGFDFQVSPFWGLSSMNVVYGSGATGLYGVPTIAGTVDFETVAPTREPHYTWTQGVGNNGKLMTGIQTSGSLSRLGYAFGYGVQGTQGNLVGSPTQRNLLTNPQNCNPNVADSLPSIRRVDVGACSYPVSGDYLLRTGIAKLTYDFGRDTQLLVSTFNETMSADSTGNGDTDYVPVEFNNFNTPTAPAADTQTLPSGATVTCNNAYVVLNDTAAGFQCMGATQYNQTFSGPAGGGIGRYHAAMWADYHARITQRIGPTQLIVDGFVDNYNFDNVKGPAPAHHFNDIYRTHGFLVSDEYQAGKNDISGGIFLQHQQHVGQDIGAGTTFPDLQLSATNYFVRDTYTPNSRFATFLDLAVQRFHETSNTFVNPRLSLMYRPTPNDVVRIAGGRSSSVPDPSLLAGGFQWGAPQSYNPTCFGGALDSIGSGNNPNLQPENANDYELAYGHRFNARTVLQADVYDSDLINPIVSGTFPLSTVPSGDLPDLTPFVAKLHTKCPSLDASHFGVSDMFNAGSGKFRGFDVSVRAGVVRNFEIDGTYAVQSAAYSGMDENILNNNPFLINGSQFNGIPLRRGNIGLGYANPSGFSTRMDGYYIGAPNGFNRPPYWYANYSIGQSFPAGMTLNFGVNNIFNSNAQQYGFIGFGRPRDQNQFGSGDNNPLAEGIEEFGLPYRQIWLTITQKI